ncbi:RNA-binding protein [Microbulbifer sp. A4B17]|uniref:RNA recognition motif domain-containing protein n=1 Tax=Microbulbifer sp. A4B17 TaxID=359370 RepID=UPI000D52F172|nr:RNA-binding protein [Microbulbifer sp. A4B17]AWF80538.1 RNA-binding protein [Microbulbifer sp. A4B17]
MNIYIGNLAYDVTSDHLHEAFGAFGYISRATVITDRETGRSRGFGFVEMPNNNEARKAIKEMNEQPLSGRNIRVNEAKPRVDRPRHPRF